MMALAHALAHAARDEWIHIAHLKFSYVMLSQHFVSEFLVVSSEQNNSSYTVVGKSNTKEHGVQSWA